MDLRNAAEAVRRRGRYGDDVLVHMNKAELAGLSSLVPGGLPRNPDTGQPEAFLLGMLAPLLGGVIGSAVAPALGVSSLLASSIGSGLAGWGATGDIGKGIASGLSAYGMGGVLNSLASAPEALTAGTGAISDTAKELAANAAQSGFQTPGAVTAPMGTPGASDVYTMAASQAAGGQVGGLSPVPVGGVGEMPFLDKLSAAGRTLGAPGGMKALGSAVWDNKMPLMLGLPSLLSPSAAISQSGSSKKDDETDEIPNSGIYPRTATYPGMGYRPGYSPEHRYFADGGPVEAPREPADSGDPAVKEAVKALMGISENPRLAIQNFLEGYGPEAFERLMQNVKRMDYGNMVKGQGTGASDSIPGTIEGNEDVRLSDGEYIIPADVVSAMGDGSSDAGARQLDTLVKRIRTVKTGRADRPPALAEVVDA